MFLLLYLALTIGASFWVIYFHVPSLHRRLVARTVKYLSEQCQDSRIGREKAVVFGRIAAEALPSNGKGLRVLEMGARMGSNLKYYPPRTRLTVVESNPHFKTHLMQALKQHEDNQITLERYIVAQPHSLEKVSHLVSPGSLD